MSFYLFNQSLVLLDLVLNLEDPRYVCIVNVVFLVQLASSFSKHCIHLYKRALTSSISYLILVTSTRERLEDIESPFKLDGLSRFTFEVCRIPSAEPSC